MLPDLNAIFPNTGLSRFTCDQNNMTRQVHVLAASTLNCAGFEALEMLQHAQDYPANVCCVCIWTCVVGKNSAMADDT